MVARPVGVALVGALALALAPMQRSHNGNAEWSRFWSEAHDSSQRKGVFRKKRNFPQARTFCVCLPVSLST